MDTTGAGIETITAGIRVDCFMLADAAQESGGKLYVLGGGWDTVFAPALPIRPHSLAVVAKLSVPWTEANRPRAFRIEVRDPDTGLDTLPRPLEGQFNVGRPVAALPGDDLTIVAAITMNGVEFHKTGTYSFRLLIDGEEHAVTKLSARLTGPAQPR